MALGLTSAARLNRYAEANGGQRGVRKLRLVLHSDAPAITRYEAENRLAKALVQASLPSPERNVQILGWEVDFYWSDAGFYVEVDGGAVHSTPRKFERDRRRDAEFQLNGLVGQRVTWRQITREARATVRRIERGHAMAAARHQFASRSETR